ncbi:MAG TPA: sulfite dehydrogenase [Devosiaceae bacterium]|jgi:sulfane dehydrogenase subunit SoxC
MARKRNGESLGQDLGEPAAGNGLLHRRAFLQGGIAFTGGAAALAVGSQPGLAASAQANPIGNGSPPWMTTPGKLFSPYGMPAEAESGVVRTFALNKLAPGVGSSRTPHHRLDGTITPNGLHFERYHNGVPDIDPAKHELVIHGLVDRPLVFSLDKLLRYPMESHIRFIECAGNSASAAGAAPPQANVQSIHGLLSCSEWTGVPLSVLLDEAGVQKGASWILAEGADAAGMGRSIPLDKAMDDTILALYQNGEALRPEQGYPMRLVVPGFQGNINVKWLRRIKVTDGPTQTRDEIAHYTELMKDGKARQFWLEYGPKSFIARPSFGVNLTGPGYYEISGLAWSGTGRVAKVEVSADGGKSWAEAALNEPVLSKALTRFRLPWQWDGQPAVLMSRATDERGIVQPTHDEWSATFAPGQIYMYNGIQNWAINDKGEVANV